MGSPAPQTEAALRHEGGDSSYPLLLPIAVCLQIPIILFTAAGFQVALTLLLAPLAGLCLLLAPARLRNLFLLCIAAGVISIVVAAAIWGGPFQPRYVFSLLLVMTPPLYFFLGWYLRARYGGFDDLLQILGVVSALFLLVLTIQVITTGAQVRWYIGVENYTVLNVDFLGLPIYGSYGVLSLASLFVLQMFVIGAAFVQSTQRFWQVVFLMGFGAGAFLVMGSNGRSVQLVLPYLLAILGVSSLFGPKVMRLKSATLLAVLLVSVAYSAARMVEPIRIVTTIAALRRMSAASDEPSRPAQDSATRSAPSRAIVVPEAEDAPVDLEKLSTGRESLLEDSLTEVARSPLVGNGFASFGRIDPDVGARSVKSRNRTTHIHYLTMLWKGGALFFVPYMTLMVAFWSRAIRGATARVTAAAIFLGAGLVFLFTILSISWDVLLVPSAGALGFFLLGMMAEGQGWNPRWLGRRRWEPLAG